MDRLQRLVETASPAADRFAALQLKLDHARIVNTDRVSSDVITMHSRVRIHDLDHDVESVCTLVFPGEANAEHSKVSVLAPLGTALLGGRVSEVIRFAAPAGDRRVRILAVEYQPETAARQRSAAAAEEALREPA